MKELLNRTTEVELLVGPGVNLMSRDHTADWVYSSPCPDPTPADERRSIYNNGNRIIRRTREQDLELHL